MKTLWLAVSGDEYELPIYVADTLKELADKMGVTQYTICHNMSRLRKLGEKNKRKYKYYKIQIGEEDETD